MFVDDIRIFEFIEHLYKLPRNNPIAPFESSNDIVQYLKTQWSGLFQRFLQEQKRLSEIKTLDEMKSVSNTLQELVKFLTEERRNKDEAIKNILMSNHPAFRRFAELTNTTYRVFFTNKNELTTWLKARGWKEIPEEDFDKDSYREWLNKVNNKYIALKEDIFDDRNILKFYDENNWSDEWIQVIETSSSSNEEDLPF